MDFSKSSLRFLLERILQEVGEEYSTLKIADSTHNLSSSGLSVNQEKNTEIISAFRYTSEDVEAAFMMRITLQVLIITYLTLYYFR